MGNVVHLVFQRKWISSIIKQNLLDRAGSMEKAPAGLAKE
jgi:hypothetical protein